jgi:hypothetical protein
MFEDWLYERFAKHPQHLEELVRVATWMISERDKIIHDYDQEEVDDRQLLTKQLETCREENKTMRTTTETLRKEKAALHQKVQDVSNHHAKIFKSALASARKERTHALRTGLADMKEKNKRLESLMIKRDAQIGRLKAAVKSGGANPPPVVSPSKARARTPTGRRRGIPDVEEEKKEENNYDTLFVLRNEPSSMSKEGDVEDVFLIPPSVSSRRRKRPRRGAERADWESAPLSSVTNATEPEQLYLLALEEIRQLSVIGGGGGGADDDDDDDDDGTGRTTTRMEEMRAVATEYHANVAKVLLWHGIKRLKKIGEKMSTSTSLEKKKKKILKAKMTVKMSRIFDFMNELDVAIVYAEQGARLWKALDFHLRSLSTNLHALAMACESNDVDIAEVIALRLMDDSKAQPGTKEIVAGYLRTVREVMKSSSSGMRLVVDRRSGWPFTCLLRPAGEEHEM